MAQDGKAHDIVHGELAGRVEREGVAGQGGDAKADEDGLLDGFVAAPARRQRAMSGGS